MENLFKLIRVRIISHPFDSVMLIDKCADCATRSSMGQRALVRSLFFLSFWFPYDATIIVSRTAKLVSSSSSSLSLARARPLSSLDGLFKERPR